MLDDAGAAIARAYDTLAERWRDGVFDASNGMQQHARALAFLEPQAGGLALSVGCGCNTRLSCLLRAHGLQIEGVDISARMLALAREADPALVLHQADIRHWQPPRSYRFITAWDSLWHVPLAQQRCVMAKLLAALDRGGVCIFSAGGLDVPHEHVDATMGPSLYYATLGIPGLLEVAAAAGCVCRHLEFDQYPEKHLYLVLQRS
jgi:predicted TPR repeat methyltransferase